MHKIFQTYETTGAAAPTEVAVETKKSSSEAVRRQHAELWHPTNAKALDKFFEEAGSTSATWSA